MVAATVAHGVLRALLEARGVRPWRLRDTLAAIPLVLMGSAGIGGAGGWASIVFVSASTSHLPVHVSAAAGAAVLATGSALLLLLGILALRKLS